MLARPLANVALALSLASCSGASGSPTVAPAPGGTADRASSIWQPSLTETFQWQLSGTLDATVPATVYDVDAFETPASFVASAHALGRHVVCYVNAGAYEAGRPDAGAFPAVVIGSPYVGYPDERWLDIRRLDLLGPIMDARLDRCRSKAFDAVEPDNVDGYQNATGFPLTAADQLAYDRFVADHAHARGLAIALKNDGEQVASLLPVFDFAITEDCWSESSCGRYTGFVTAAKPVFTVEYTDRTSLATFRQSVCPRAHEAGMNAILKARALDAARDVCP
ncbi:MAG: endo alpha-1,4 polygalactosaminidase [Vulcanimicrobiaceae bacterium]